jgi:hypothetical protein
LEDLKAKKKPKKKHAGPASTLWMLSSGSANDES